MTYPTPIVYTDLPPPLTGAPGYRVYRFDPTAIPPRRVRGYNFSDPADAPLRAGYSLPYDGGNKNGDYLVHYPRGMHEDIGGLILAQNAVSEYWHYEQNNASPIELYQWSSIYSDASEPEFVYDSGVAVATTINITKEYYWARPNAIMWHPLQIPLPSGLQSDMANYFYPAPTMIAISSHWSEARVHTSAPPLNTADRGQILTPWNWDYFPLSSNSSQDGWVTIRRGNSGVTTAYRGGQKGPTAFIKPLDHEELWHDLEGSPNGSKWTAVYGLPPSVVFRGVLSVPSGDPAPTRDDYKIRLYKVDDTYTDHTFGTASVTLSGTLYGNDYYTYEATFNTSGIDITGVHEFEVIPFTGKDFWHKTPCSCSRFAFSDEPMTGCPFTPQPIFRKKVL